MRTLTAKQLSFIPSHLSGILDIQMLQCCNRDVRDALTHRKYLGVMSAAVDDKTHCTNRCVPRTVQNTLAVPIFAPYFEHSVKSFILMKEEVGSPRNVSTFILDYTALYVNTNRKHIAKKQRNNPYE